MGNSISIQQDLVSDGFKWRCIGPPRGGRVVAVAGDPVELMTFYFGACAGGIWKTTDGGTYWECISDGYLSSATIGALAVSDSDPNVIYAGTGETTIRVDVSFGDGIYKSTDGGESWTNVGLKETRHIGEIRIHPENCDIVYVAALGHAFGENLERGVYRTTDGGENWELVLHQSPRAGAVDLSIDTNNPRIIFASIWEASRNFWNLSSGGEGSALFRSMDGGDSWEDVSVNAGFATGTKGKIGVAISPAKRGRVWALVEAKNSGLYRSENYGKTWSLISPNIDLLHRPWYYTHVFADPAHSDTVYVTNFQMWKSTDGGSVFHEVTTPHGDNHDLWIDSKNNQRMVQGNDGGANVSFNGGKTWSTIYNQMTAQFYRLDVDNQFPYRVYGTQQDNTSISVPSATEWGVITMSDCTLPGTGESGFIAVHPSNPDIVYSGAVGSSPGGNGALQRYDHSTRQIQLINVWPEESTGLAPRELRYRFAWTFPIAFSPHDISTIYAGGNHLFRSRNEGHSWEQISPDLSQNNQEQLGLSGGPLTIDSAGAEQYATLSTFAESPHRRGQLWAGTDDGLLHISQDDGKHWQLVTPDTLPELSYIGAVEISVHDPNTVYLSATRYKLDDYEPYLYCTRDGGSTWNCINGDLPAGEITRVIRSDLVQAGLLFVGTETGVFYSVNDGENWTRMGGGFPVVPVYDIKIKDSDLVVATHGRSFWILDDITPLRSMAVEHGHKNDLLLFPPCPTYRLKLQWAAGVFDGDGKDYSPAFGLAGATYRHQLPDGGSVRNHLDVGENPPAGAIVYYWLGENSKYDLELDIYDDKGGVIAHFSSAKYDKPKQRLTTKLGLNRFVWDLCYPGIKPLDPTLDTKDYEPFAKTSDARGPCVPPGQYTVRLTLGDKTYSEPLLVLKDPRVAASQSDLDEQFLLLQRLHNKKSELRIAVDNIRRMKIQLGMLREKLYSQSSAEFEASIDVIVEAMETLEGTLVDRYRESPRDVLRRPAGLEDTLGELMWSVTMSDTAPPAQTNEVSSQVIAQVDNELRKLQEIINGPVRLLNEKVISFGISLIGTD